MKRYAQKLRDKGHGPRSFDPYKYRKRRRLKDAEDAGADNKDGDEDSAEENEIRQLQEALEEGRIDADGYQPQLQLFASAEEAMESAPTQEELTDADDFDEAHEVRHES